MKRLSTASALALAAILASCASAPSLVQKERLEEYRVPLLAKETRAFADGLVDTISEYRWSESLDRLLSVTVTKPSVATPVEKAEYAYDEQGRLLTKRLYGADGSLTSTMSYEYDEAGIRVAETQRDAKDIAQSRSEWLYEGGLKTAWRVLDPSGLLLARTDYLYEGERLAEARVLGNGTTLSASIRYEYRDYPGAPGLLVREAFFDASGAPDGSVSYTRDESGQLLLETRYRDDGRRERAVSYGYGPDGELISAIYEDGSGTAREATHYEYIWRTDTRTIVYYE